MEDEFVAVGAPLPRIERVLPLNGRKVSIRWDRGPREGETEIVDLGPLIDRHAHFAPLRADERLFQGARVVNYGSALGWGEAIEMSAVSIDRLAAEARMSDQRRSVRAS